MRTLFAFDDDSQPTGEIVGVRAIPGEKYVHASVRIGIRAHEDPMNFIPIDKEAEYALIRIIGGLQPAAYAVCYHRDGDSDGVDKTNRPLESKLLAELGMGWVYA